MLRPILLVFVATLLMLGAAYMGVERVNGLSAERRKSDAINALKVASNQAKEKAEETDLPQLNCRKVGSFDVYLVNADGKTSRAMGARYVVGDNRQSRAGEAVEKALTAGQERVLWDRDYRGSDVLTYVRPVKIGGKPFALLAEQDKADVTLPASERVSILVLLYVLLLGVICAVIMGVSAAGAQSPAVELLGLYALLRNLPLYFIITDESREGNGKIILSSYACEKLFGVPHAEIEGEYLDNFFSDPAAHARMRASLPFGEGRNGREVVFNRRDGKMLNIVISLLRVALVSLKIHRGIAIGWPAEVENAQA